MPPKAAKLLGPYRKRVRTEPQPAETPELPPKKPALLGPYRKRRRANPDPPPAPALPKTYAQWPKSIQNTLQKADQHLNTQPAPNDDVVFIALHEERHMYAGTGVEVWGVYRTARSANWKTAEKFVRKYSGVREKFCEDGVSLERQAETGGQKDDRQDEEDESEYSESEYDDYGYDEQEEDDGRHHYVAGVNEEGLVKFQSINEEFVRKVYVKMEKFDD